MRKASPGLVLILVGALSGVVLAPRVSDASVRSAAPIAFTRGGDVFTILMDGSHVRRLTASNRSERAPAWSPTHSRLAFVSGQRSIHLIDADGAGERGIYRLPPRYDTIGRIAWSPTGSSIAFTSERDIRHRGLIRICSQVWVMNASGSGAHRILHAQSFSSGLSWSPAGDKLLGSFEQPSTTLPCRRDQKSGIYGFRVDGSHVRSLHARHGTDPDWSPNGSRIVFRDWRRTCHACGQIWLMRRDGSHQHLLAAPPKAYLGYYAPAWSPNGRSITFIAQRNGRFSLWKMRSDGGHVRRLLRHADDVDW